AFVAVADASLAELHEAGKITTDLRRIDVRVVGDLLRRNAVLADLAGLRQHLEVPAQTRGHADRQSLSHRSSSFDACNTTERFCQRPAASCRIQLTGLGARRSEPAAEGFHGHEVHERPLAVDLDNRKPLAVA